MGASNPQRSLPTVAKADLANRLARAWIRGGAPDPTSVSAKIAYFSRSGAFDVRRRSARVPKPVDALRRYPELHESRRRAGVDERGRRFLSTRNCARDNFCQAGGKTNFLDAAPRRSHVQR